MALNSTQCAADISAAYDALKAADPEADFPLDFATAYDDYAAEGVVVGAINTGGDASVIEDLLREGEPTPVDLGNALAAYWATVALVPQPPDVAVESDAATKGPAFTTAIIASLSIVESNPPYKAFIDNLEGVARGIIWTVTNASGVTRPETIT